MATDKNIIKSPEFWGIFLASIVAAIVAIFTFYQTEQTKLRWEQYKRKEARYISLIKSTKGFHVSSSDKNLKENFLEELNLCWLYAPDAVIYKGYIFLETVHVGAKKSNDEKNLAMGDFISEIRNDMLSDKIIDKTSLSGNDFRILRAN
jgi:hypothetical protein